jgi:hypothetical protein
LRDVAQIKFAGATPAATFDGKVVAAVWRRGKGQVLLLGGTIGNDALVESRRRLLENIPGAWDDFPKETRERTELFRALTEQLQQWALVTPQGARSDSPVDVALRQTRRGVSIALHNPGEKPLARVTLQLSGIAAGVTSARVTYPDRIETLPVRHSATATEIELLNLPPGGFCLIQF